MFQELKLRNRTLSEFICILYLWVYYFCARVSVKYVVVTVVIIIWTGGVFSGWSWAPPVGWSDTRMVSSLARACSAELACSFSLSFYLGWWRVVVLIIISTSRMKRHPHGFLSRSSLLGWDGVFFLSFVLFPSSPSVSRSVWVQRNAMLVRETWASLERSRRSAFILLILMAFSSLWGFLGRNTLGIISWKIVFPLTRPHPFTGRVIYYRFHGHNFGHSSRIVND